MSWYEVKNDGVFAGLTVQCTLINQRLDLVLLAVHVFPAWIQSVTHKASNISDHENLKIDAVH